jgi:hypothetical protein
LSRSEFPSLEVFLGGLESLETKQESPSIRSFTLAAPR